MRILLIEDDRAIGEAVRDHAAADGHAVDWAKTLKSAKEHADVAIYALVLLDLHLPDGNGLDYLRAMRHRQVTTPVIVLTARDQISDRIEGLNSGADDYLVKPFDLGELSARIRAVARRHGPPSVPVVRAGPIEIAASERSIRRGHETISLTSREWAVLESLLRRPATIVSKPQIEEALYAFGSEIESNTVEVYVSRLRKKLGNERISTVRGLGYRFEK